MSYTFISSNSIKINLSDEDKRQIAPFESINKAIKLDSVIAFDIFYNDDLIGFAMLRKYDNGYFLWNYAIDAKFQGKGDGINALIELLEYLKSDYCVTEVSTTYLYGNERAKHVYEKVGFIETEVIDEEDVHEVNMVIRL